MNYKKWLIGVSITTFTLYLVTVLLHYLINPSQLFKHSITQKKFLNTKEYSKIQFNLLKENKYTLVFGSSRDVRISSNMLNESVLNLANLYTEPGDIYNFLSQLNSRQIGNIRKILFLVDVHTFRDEINKNKIDYINTNYTSLISDVFLMNSSKILSTKNDLVFNYIKKPDYYIHKDGSSIPFIEKTTYQTSVVFKSQERQRYTKKSLLTFTKINDFVKNNQIETIYFTPTFMDMMFAKIDLNLEKEKYKHLLENNIKGLHILLYLNKVSNLKDNNHYFAFSDASHLNAKYLKKSLYNNIFNNKNNSTYVTNIMELNTYFKKLENIQKNLQQK